VQLPDGKIAVYGHLSRYAPVLESMVEKEQDLRGTYQIEIFCEPRAFIFARGDTLAFSGETGSGPPHLHFELRSGRHDHDKINPIPEHMDLVEGFEPEIRNVMVTPLDAEATVDGKHGPVRIRRRDLGDTLRVGGEFGVSIQAVDRVQCGRVLTPIMYEAFFDDVSVWRLDLDRFPFSKAHFVGGLSFGSGGETYVRLYDPYALDLRGFTCLQQAGASRPDRLNEGAHVLRLRAADAWGNSDEAAIPFIYGTAPKFEVFRLVPDSLGMNIELSTYPEDCIVDVKYRVRGSDWGAIIMAGGPGIRRHHISATGHPIEVHCRLENEYGFTRECTLSNRREREAASTGAGDGSPPGDGIRPGSARVTARTVLHPEFLEILGSCRMPPASLPTAWIHEGNRVSSTVLQPVGEDGFRGVYIPNSDPEVIHTRIAFEFVQGKVEHTEGLAVGRLRPGAEVWFTGQMFKVRLWAPHSYSSQTLVRFKEDEGVIGEGFARTLGSIHFEPDGMFFNDGVEVLVIPRAAELTSKCGLFRGSDGSGGYLGKFDDTGACMVELRHLTDLAVLEDMEPPVLEWVGGMRVRGSDGKGVFEARARDSGSGLDTGSIKGFVDGDTAIVAYDPDTGRLSARSRKPLRYGEHRIRLEVKDRMGNSAIIEQVADLLR
jgi:hypothetical protein